jgi:nucleoside diphosphate kinase
VSFAVELANTTCGVVKPDAVHSGIAKRIIREIVAAAFTITGALMTWLDPGAADEFLKVDRGIVMDFNDMAKEMAFEPSLALDIAKRENRRGIQRGVLAKRCRRRRTDSAEIYQNAV